MAIDYKTESLTIKANRFDAKAWQPERSERVRLERDDKFDRIEPSTESDEKAESAVRGLFEFAGHITGFETLQKFIQYLVPALLEIHGENFISALRRLQNEMNADVFAEVLLSLSMVDGPIALRSRVALISDFIQSENASIRESARDALELIHDYAMVAVD